MPSDRAVFDRAVAFVIDNLEGTVLATDNNGAPVKFGINQASYPQIDVSKLTREEAVEIYWRDYWCAMSCPDMPPWLAIQVFDSAINQGVGGATRVLQAALAIVNDGILGPITRARAASQPDRDVGMAKRLARKRIERYCATVGAFRLNGIPTPEMQSWIKRSIDVLVLGLGVDR